MKYIISIIICLLAIIACKTPQSNLDKIDTSDVLNDTIRIANAELEYEIIIIDSRFSSWLISNARQRGFYSQEYLEARNLDWVSAWNQNYLSLNNSDLYLTSIEYNYGINYGYEVNYLLYNYLVYFQTINKIKLGSFVARP